MNGASAITAFGQLNSLHVVAFVLIMVAIARPEWVSALYKRVFGARQVSKPQPQAQTHAHPHFGKDATKAEIVGARLDEHERHCDERQRLMQEQIDRRFDATDKKIDATDKKIDGIHTLIGGINQRLDALVESKR